MHFLRCVNSGTHDLATKMSCFSQGSGVEPLTSVLYAVPGCSLEALVQVLRAAHNDADFVIPRGPGGGGPGSIQTITTIRFRAAVDGASSRAILRVKLACTPGFF